MRFRGPYLWIIGLVVLAFFSCGNQTSEKATKPSAKRSSQSQKGAGMQPSYKSAEKASAAPSGAHIQHNQAQTNEFETPISVGDLYEAFYADKDAWLEKSVTVVGYFQGKGHSLETDQTRIDLKTNRRGKTLVGCFIEGSAALPQGLAENPEGVVMRGIVTYPFFGQVILKDASFVNRP